MSEGVRTRRQRRVSEEAAAKEKRRRSIGEVLSHGREVPKGVPLDTGLAMLTEEQEGSGLRVDSAVESAEAYAKERSPRSKIPPTSVKGVMTPPVRGDGAAGSQVSGLAESAEIKNKKRQLVTHY